MNLDIWFSWYKRIIDEFGFSKDDDEKSAEILNTLLKEQKSLKLHEIKMKNKVIVFGAGPSLKRNIRELKKENLDDFTLMAADGATTALIEENIIPDIIVTDLDGKIDDILKANNGGAILAVHAHGNNMDKIREYVPKLHDIIGTTQSIPLENVHNFGGFTDGDRCIFLAIEFRVKFIVLAGMDFGDIVTKYSRPDLEKYEDMADEIKRGKLKYAKELTEWAAENENMEILNLSGGERIENVKNIDMIEFKNFFQINNK